MAQDAFEVLMNPSKPDPLVWAAVYRARLDHVPHSIVLKGTAYIGQTVGKAASADVLAAKRWAQEVSQAKRQDHHEVGFVAAISIFGQHAFEWEVLESRYGPREEVQKWADEREIALIASHGGCLQDMDPVVPITQTFNQQKGGKGAWSWKGVEAWCAKRWKRFQEEILAYSKEYGTTLIPQDFETDNGYRLGMRLGHVRCGDMLNNRADESDRREWLERLPEWTWDAQRDRRDAAWMRFKEEMQEYVDENGTSLIPQKFVTATGYRLGANLRNARQGQLLLNRPEEVFRRKWLESLPDWTWKIPEEKRSADQSKFVKDKWKDPEFKDRLLETRADTNAKLKRARWVKAREEALPHEPNPAKRVKGQLYHRPDGWIGKWTIRSFNLVCPSVDRMPN